MRDKIFNEPKMRKSIVGANATLMFHDVTTWVHDKTRGVQQELEEAKRLSEKYCDAIIAGTLYQH